MGYELEKSPDRVYKIWIHVECIDEVRDIYEDIGIPILYGEYPTEEEAIAAAEVLAGNGQQILE